MQFIPYPKEVIMEDTQNGVQLSAKRKSDIEKFWQKVNEKNLFHRGEVFTVHSIIEKENVYKVMLNRTDYAHYLHTVRNHITDEEGCKIIYGAGLVETKDSRFVFGEMGCHTAYPGRLQCVGGGLNWKDKKGNHFDMKKSVLRELNEELGIDCSNHIEKCTPVFIKIGGTYDFLAILYHIKLNILERELIMNYQIFTERLLAQGKKPEFQKVIYLENNQEAVTAFFNNDNRYCVDYLEPYLRRMVNRK